MNRANFVCAFLLALSGASGQEGRGGANLPPAQIAGEISGERISNPGKQGDWPAIAYGKDGSLWAFWIEWNDKDADRVLIRRRDPQGRWGNEIPIEDGNWDHYSPAIVARPNGAMAIWSRQSADHYDFYAPPISDAGRVSKPQRLTTAVFSDFNARAVSDAAGSVTVVWQSFRNGNGDIYARRFAKESWGPETRVSVSDSNDWEPAVALDPNGVAWISWDGYAAGNYDVYLRSFDGAKLGNVIPITTEPTAQFHTSLAVDREGRVWVAWDEADQNWGKDFSDVSAAPGSRGLHYSRRLGVRVYANGRVQNPSGDLAAALTGRMTRYAELPHLTIDGRGSLWMIFRHWTLPQPHEIYHFYATRLSGDKWSQPLKFTDSSGQNTQHASLAVAPHGERWTAYSSDGRGPDVEITDPVHSPHYNVYIAKVPPGDGPPKISLTDAHLPSPSTRPPLRPRATMTVAGKTYFLLLGDAHRHTHNPRHSSGDGSLLDTHPYPLDTAQPHLRRPPHPHPVARRPWPPRL